LPRRSTIRAGRRAGGPGRDGTAALNTGTNTVTYTVTTPASIASGTSVLISLDGFTNTLTAGTYASAETTLTGGAAIIDTGNSNSVGINTSTTAVTVVVARSTSFSSDTAAPAPSDVSRTGAINVTSPTAAVLPVPNASAGLTVPAAVVLQIDPRSLPDSTVVDTVTVATTATNGYTLAVAGSAITGAGGTACGSTTCRPPVCTAAP
jgi:hypothetical protein